MNRRYGFLGFLSLIGILGVMIHDSAYYPFLAFMLFFEYFFVQTDEMFMEHLRKAASWAFYTNLAATTAATCYWTIVKHLPDGALLKGIGLGFGASLVVFSFATACFDWKDRRGTSHD